LQLIIIIIIIIIIITLVFLGGGDSLLWARASSFTKFLVHTQGRIKFGRTPLDE